jgi:nitric oxide reductase NorQ protein
MSKSNPLIVTVKPLGKSFVVKDQDGNSINLSTTPIPDWMLRKAVKENVQLKETFTVRGIEWRRVKTKKLDVKSTEQSVPVVTSTTSVPPPMDFSAFKSDDANVISQNADQPVYEIPKDHNDVIKFIVSSYSLKPKGLVMPELKWKYLIRSALRGKNILMLGDSGSGKTLAAKCLAASLKRPTEIFNLGSTQDPRSFLIGNTHFDKEKGTYFSESLFVKMLRTPNAIIVLDELSRAHPDAWNILMPVLDVNQRYLRLEEKDDSETVKIADGVTFIATANVGNQYTATRVLDQALFERFIVVEMELLSLEQETGLLTYMYPSVPVKVLAAIAGIASDSRFEVQSASAKLTKPISTRISVEMAGLMFDGFKLTEAAEVAIYPFYEKEGGSDSERLYVKQIVQKYVSIDEQTHGHIEAEDDALFSDAEVKQAPSAAHP